MVNGTRNKLPDTAMILPDAEISSDHVRAALANLLYSGPALSSNPLQHLRLVDQVLADPAFPHVSHSRQYALTYILTSAITQGWKHQRFLLGLELLPEKATRLEAYDDLEKAVQQGFSELICWSILYYRYVCVDLDIPLPHFYKLLGVEERTFRRYQHRGILRLTHWLIQEEWQARFCKIMRGDALQSANSARTGLLM